MELFFVFVLTALAGEQLLNPQPIPEPQPEEDVEVETEEEGGGHVNGIRPVAPWNGNLTVTVGWNRTCSPETFLFISISCHCLFFRKSQPPEQQNHKGNCHHNMLWARGN